jgi:hypothetical protein
MRERRQETERPYNPDAGSGRLAKGPAPAARSPPIYPLSSPSCQIEADTVRRGLGRGMRYGFTHW